MSENDGYQPVKDYRNVPIPEDKEKSEYGTYQRRADIYRRIKENGFGGIPTYEELADEYDMSKSTIGNDIQRLRKYILHVEMDVERVRATIAQTMQWAIQQAEQEGDYKEATKIAERWYEWLSELGVEHKEPDKHKVEHSGSVDADFFRDYVSEDDDE